MQWIPTTLSLQLHWPVLSSQVMLDDPSVLQLQGSAWKLISINTEKAKKDLKNTEKLFETLMGKQAELRFQFIQKNTNFIKNLDI